MKIFLIAGNEHEYITQYVSHMRKPIIVNKNAVLLSEAVDYIKDNPAPMDAVLVTDGGLSANSSDYVYELEQLLNLTGVGITVVTRDFLFTAENNEIRVVISSWFRALEQDFLSVFEDTKEETAKFGAVQPGRRPKTDVNKQLTEENPAMFGIVQPKTAPKANAYEQPREGQPEVGEIVVRNKKWGFLKQRIEGNVGDKGENGSVSIASSKVIVFTGHRNSGVTSSAVNVAWCANRRGINAILIDFDTDYRSINLYFSKFYSQADEDDEISASLVRTLAQPQNYKTSAVRIESGFWVTSLGYGFSDERLLSQHFTKSKMIGMITSLKHSFDLIAVDFPLDLLAKAPDMLNSVDVVALCMENSIYSAITTLRNIVIGFDDREWISYIASKAKLIVTKYNNESTYGDEIITPGRLSELIVSEGFCEDFTEELPVAGSVPYIRWFGKQIESDIPVIDMDSGMKQAYDGIILRLLGAR